MKLHLICCVLILALLPSRPDALRIYKTRDEVLNLLGTDALGEERLYMEFCLQSSATGNCMLAIDDSIPNEWTQCSSSEPEDNAWWRAELEIPSYITRVVINTAELPDVELNNALWDFSIDANEFTCHRHKIFPFTSMSFDCDALANALVIQSKRNRAILSLCEVIPYGIPVQFNGMDFGAMEVMVSGCDQSSILQGKDCNYALDRNFETNPSPTNGKQCAETRLEPLSFFVAYFPLPTLVKYVKIFQHTRGEHRMRNFRIEVNGMICNKYKSNKDFESRVFPCQRFGSKLEIYNFPHDKNTRTAFSICQVQVFGHEMAIRRPADRKYVGCFNDNPEKPDLDLMMALTRMSPSKCHQICKRANKKFFGLQNGQVCMCGDKYGRYGEVGEDGNGNSTVSTETAASGSVEPCGSPCVGANEHKCGGRNQNSVYEIIV